MGGKFQADYRVGALRTLKTGCRKGSRGTDFQSVTPVDGAKRNRTAGLTPGRPDEGVWAYVWPPRRGRLHAIKPKTCLMGTPASGPTCLDQRPNFRRTTPAIPISPVPIRAMVSSSGTAAWLFSVINASLFGVMNLSLPYTTIIA